jgi:hypothetical protein
MRIEEGALKSDGDLRLNRREAQRDGVPQWQRRTDFDDVAERREAVACDAKPMDAEWQPLRDGDAVARRLERLAPLVRFADQLDARLERKSGRIAHRHAQLPGVRLSELRHHQHDDPGAG